MSAGVTTTVRLAVSGNAGTVDLLVPLSAAVHHVAARYADELGLAEEPRLATLRGRLLADDRRLVDLNLSHGAVLVALDASPDDVEDVELSEPSAQVALSVASSRLVVVALIAGGMSAFAAAAGGDQAWQSGAAAVLLLGAVGALISPASPTLAGLTVTRRAAPGLAAAGAFCGLYRADSGSLLLAVAVAGLVAGTAAALGRSDGDVRIDDVMKVWLIAAALVTVVAGLLLFVGADRVALWAALLAIAVVVAKLLPGTAVDVPDDALLDLDRLAVTAWSARETPRHDRRRKARVNPAAIADVVHRGHRLVSAVMVGVAATVILVAPMSLVGRDLDVGGIGALAQIGLAGAALALMSRSFRAPAPRLALRISGAWCLVLVPLALVFSLDQSRVFTVVGVTVALAVPVLIAAAAMGRGWRSVWWARAGEVAEELSVALSIAALPLAAGLFTYVQALP